MNDGLQILSWTVLAAVFYITVYPFVQEAQAWFFISIARAVSQRRKHGAKDESKESVER